MDLRIGSADRAHTSQGAAMKKQTTCPECLKTLSFDSSKGGQAVRCPHCSKAVRLPETKKPPELPKTVEKPPVPFEPAAKLIQNSEFAGTGCLIQGLGLLVFLLIPVLGALIGRNAGFVISIFIAIPTAWIVIKIGGDRARSWVCSECYTKANSRKAKICVGCKQDFAI